MFACSHAFLFLMENMLCVWVFLFPKLALTSVHIILIGRDKRGKIT